MKQKYIYCNKCEDYTKFNYLEMYKIENLTSITNDVLVMYECSKCHSQKPQFAQFFLFILPLLKI